MIGTIDDGFVCADSNCRATAHDITDEDRGIWRIECAFCGTGQRVRAIPGHLKPEDVFVLRQGRFAGKTLSQVAREHHGMEYLIWAEKSHKSHTVREAVKTHLDAQKIAR